MRISRGKLQRMFGWFLLALGTLGLGRTAWLMANYWWNMSEIFRQRGCILLAVSFCIALFGAWLVHRGRAKA